MIMLRCSARAICLKPGASRSTPAELHRQDACCALCLEQSCSASLEAGSSASPLCDVPLSSTHTRASAGKRKTSIARAWLAEGSGAITINGRPLTRYFTPLLRREDVLEPFQVGGLCCCSAMEGIYREFDRPFISSAALHIVSGTGLLSAMLLPAVHCAPRD